MSDIGQSQPAASVAIRRESQPRQDGTCIHVDRVVARHELLDLAQRQPPEVLADVNLLVDTDYDVTVALPEEPGTLLALQLVEHYLILPCAPEIVEIRRTFPAVDARVVAACRLERRRELHAIYVARLDLRLQKEIKHPVDFLAYYAKTSDLGLVDDGLPPSRYAILVLVDVDTLYREELPGLMAKVAGRGVEAPTLQLRERNLLDLHFNLTIPAFDPRKNLPRRVKRVAGRQKRFQQGIHQASHGTIPLSGGCRRSFGDRIGSHPMSGQEIPSAGSSNFMPRSDSGW